MRGLAYTDNKIYADVCSICSMGSVGGDLDSRRASELRENDADAVRRVRELCREGRLFCERVELPFSLCGHEAFLQGDVLFSKNGDEITVFEYRTMHSYFAFKTPPLQAFLPLRALAYIYCERYGLGGVNISLELSFGNKEKSVRSYADIDSLRLSFYSAVSLAEPRIAQFLNKYEVRIPSVRDTSSFPFGTLREGQEELIGECYRAVRTKKRLFAEAPTGIGKTISTLYPAARALGNGYCERIFYLTARASTRREAFSAAKKLFLGGARLRTCIISAKEQVCICEAAKGGRVSSYCNPDDCPYARGYYDRADGAIFELLSTCNGYSRTAIEDAARRHSVCPYELSLDLSEFCDIIICDYNYAFDPAVYLRRYFSPESGVGGNVFLVDEAHNLPDRARDMYSAEIRRSSFEAVYARVKEDPELDSALTSVILNIRALRKLCRDTLVKAEDGERGFYMSRSPIPGFADKLRASLTEIDRWLRDKREHPLFSSVSDLSSSLRKYLRVCEYYDDKFLTYVEIFGGDTRVRLFCLDPSGVIGDRLKRASSAIFFSATLTPLDYFRDLLGGGGDCPTLELSSPFDPENLCVAAVDTVSTKSDDRDERTFRKIATYIAATVSAKAGNYICYFPSYSFMESVHRAFLKKYPNVKTVLQKRGMSLSAKESFLSAFKNDEGILRVGFCVLGGSFSEGVDLPGSRLIGSIVVGVGIPALSNERNIIRDYYEEANGRGYDYSYSFPGMNSVLQAAGRVIRRDDDRGIVVLIDSRYGEPLYASLFPEHWDGIKFAGNPASLAEIARRFWKKHEKS